MSIEKLREEVIEKTKEQVKEKLAGKEVHIIKAVNTLEDLDLVFNMLFENARDWYSLHFPELFRLVKEPEKSLALIANITSRENYTKDEILKYYANESVAEELAKKAKGSAGSELNSEQAQVIKELAKKALEIKKYREVLAEFIEKEMQAKLPNLARVAGPLLGARLLREAKSLQKLAFMPSSTIQVIGAEKALFKHLRKGTKPPKHGIIFQHPLLRKVRREHRGKMARALANKISLAIKADYFGKREISERFAKELEEKAKLLS
jgi:nucleolar protein 56